MSNETDVSQPVDGEGVPERIWLLRNEDGSLDDHWQMSTIEGSGDIEFVRAVRATQPATGPSEHVDAVILNGPLEGSGFCKVCGLMRPYDGWKKPCSGRTPEISLRTTPTDIAKKARRAVEAFDYYWTGIGMPVLGIRQKLALADIIAAEFEGREK